MTAHSFHKIWLDLRNLAITLVVFLVACSSEPIPQKFVTESNLDGISNGGPKRIVSLDFCADQYVLKLSDRDSIVALSPDAEKSFSYLRDQAAGIQQVRPIVETILELQPDLVVRSYGGGPNINQFLSSVGIPVLNIGWAGDVTGIKQVTREVATGLGVPARGESLVAEMEARIAALPSRNSPDVALYMTPSGATSGPGSLVHNLLEIAGLSNFETEPGWRSLPLEELAYQKPDLVAAAFFNTHGNDPSSWSAMRHPIARSQLTELPTVYLDGAWMSCGAWFVVDAIEALAKPGPVSSR